ncbi:MAG: hypothetical protein EPO35_02055 [Acidobacteria bacterium]|nr:MAG: hypothetical protein EPO35_02055 [Acidobacteriota bacterium]
MPAGSRRTARIAFIALEVSAAFVFFVVMLHHIYHFDFKPLAALCVPILVVFFSFTGLLYSRGRALPDGEGQTRSLYAAERSMQATMWYLLGIIVGVSVYGLLVYFKVSFDPTQPSAAGFALLLFVAPYALMQTGLLFFMRAAWIIAPEFFGRVNATEIRRRVQR